MEAAGAKHMQCMEVWGGNRGTDSGVIMPGLDAWVYAEPCRNEAEGGDVHYVSTCAGGRVVRMLVADVAGHGLSVAETAAHLRTLMRRHINRHDQLGFMRSLNREFTAASREGSFATAVVMTFDSPTNELKVSNAGHPPPLYYSAAERTWTYLQQREPGEAGNVPWGIDGTGEYEQFTVRLRVGDIVLAYTDSLTEARDAENRILGEEALLELVRGMGAPVPGTLVKDLLSRIDARGKGSLLRDDVTCLLFRPNGLRPYVPVTDYMLAPLRVVADWAGVHFGWRGNKGAERV